LPATRRPVVALGAAIVVAIVSVTMALARVTREAASSAPLLAFTATAFVYEPVIFRGYAPSTPTPTDTLTPTPTATPTATPIPEQIRMYLCCFAINATCQGCSGSYPFYPSPPNNMWEWESDPLSMDIGGSAYEFSIAASSTSNTVFQVELYLVQAEELLLASTSFSADSSEPARYTRGVQGIDPTVTIGQDRLLVRITNIGGTTGDIYFGDPATAGAGGSYFEFPRAQ
jgi:hypothetical protein